MSPRQEPGPPGLVVVVPGIGGSVLTRDGAPVWDLRKRTVLHHLRDRGKAIEQLALPDGTGDGPARDGILAAGLVDDLSVLPGIWTPIDGYAHLTSHLTDTCERTLITDNSVDGADPGDLLAFAYDWRLSNRYNAERLGDEIDAAQRRRQRLGQREGSGIVLICHSMGGLIARYWADVLQPDVDVAAMFTLGTPHRGALKALDVLVNGVPHTFGKLRSRLNGFVRSLPSVYELLPEFACIDTGPELPDWFDAARCGLDVWMASRAGEFHKEIDTITAPRYLGYWWVGAYQETNLSALVDDHGVLEPSTYYRGRPQTYAGDGTVPHFAATPEWASVADPRRRAVAQSHGALVNDRRVFDEITLVVNPVVFRATTAEGSAPDLGPRLRVDLPEAVVEGVDVHVEISAPGDIEMLTVVHELDGQRTERSIRPADGRCAYTVPSAAVGIHTIAVTPTPTLGATPSNARTQREVLVVPADVADG